LYPCGTFQRHQLFAPQSPASSPARNKLRPADWNSSAGAASDLRKAASDILHEKHSPVRFHRSRAARKFVLSVQQLGEVFDPAQAYCDNVKSFLELEAKFAAAATRLGEALKNYLRPRKSPNER